MLGLWHVAQLTVLSFDSLVSKYSFFPSSILAPDWGLPGGIGAGDNFPTCTGPSEKLACIVVGGTGGSSANTAGGTNNNPMTRQNHTLFILPSMQEYHRPDHYAKPGLAILLE